MLHIGPSKQSSTPKVARSSEKNPIGGAIENKWLDLNPSRCYNVLSHSWHHLFPGSAASRRLSSEMPWASCWCSTWPTSRVSSTSGTGWVGVLSAASALSPFREMTAVAVGEMQICLLVLDWGSFQNGVSSSLMHVYLASRGSSESCSFSQVSSRPTRTVTIQTLC